MKRPFLFFYFILIGGPLYLYACDTVSAHEISFQPFEKTLHLTKKDKCRETHQETESVPKTRHDKRAANRNANSPLITSPLGEEISVTGRRNVTEYLAKEVEIPTNFKPLRLYNNRYTNRLKQARGETNQLTNKVGNKLIRRLDSQNENISLIFYSNKLGAAFFITEDTRDLMTSSQQLLTQAPKTEGINEVIKDLETALSTLPGGLIPSPKQSSHLLDHEKFKTLDKASPLKGITRFYRRNGKLLTALLGKSETFEEKLKKHQDPYLPAEENYALHQILIDQKIFKNILKREYQAEYNTNLKGHIDVFNIINQWGEINNSFLMDASYYIDAPEKEQVGIAFYENVIFPILDRLFRNQKGLYFDYTNIFAFGEELVPKEGDTIEENTDDTVDMIKYKIDGLNTVPGFSLYRCNPISAN